MENEFFEQQQALNKKQKNEKSHYSLLAFNATKRILHYLRERYDFRLNLGNQKLEFRKVGKATYRDLTDTDFNSIRVEMNLDNIPCSKDNLKSILFSNQWEQYDPYKKFLSDLPEWDGHDYISDLASTVKTDSQAYWEWCLRKWMVAMVGSLDDDETVNQTALIFCGGQGIGKSTWFRNILPPELRKYSSSGFLDPKDKETLIQLSELCLYNMDEVENLKPQNVEAIKELITKQSMYLRRAYTTLSQNYVRHVSFCGTANGTDILHDITGNRRFLCQNVLSIDYKLEGFNLPQLYAQAYQLFRTGFHFWLDAEEQAKVEKHNARFRAESLEEELINTYFESCQTDDEGTKRMQAQEIVSYLRRKEPYAKISHVNVGRVLSSKGYVKKKSSGISKWIVKEKNLTESDKE